MDVLDLVAKLALDDTDYDKGLQQAETKGGAFASLLGKGMAAGTVALFSAAAAGTAAVGAGVANLTKQATDAYGQYEQLAGGIETLFGESAYKVMDDAANAYATAGMSINQYMETSIQGAAALINSLEGDQEKAAELMNVSIIDMSDNVNKMGTTMEAVQNAYRGFSRGNFTMLDNLALGFSGTKEGMQELLEKAHEISGIEYDIDSYADIVQAIHTVQQAMGISGTTMEEAGKTITGSMGAVRAAWDNLITGLANEDADIGDLFDKLLTSIFGENGEGGFLSNMLPRIEQALKGVAEFIKVGAQRLPEVAKDILPDLITEFVDVVNELVNGLTENSDEVIENLSKLLEVVIEQALRLLTTIIKALPTIFEVALTVITTLAEGLSEALPELVPTIVEVVIAIVETLANNLDKIISAAVQIIAALVEGIVEALPMLDNEIWIVMLQIIAAIIRALPDIVKSGNDIVLSLFDGIVDLGLRLVNGDMLRGLLDELKNIWLSVDWIDVGKNIIIGIRDGITGTVSLVVDAMGNLVDSAKNALTNPLKIHSPSKLFEEYGQMIDAGLTMGISGGEEDVINSVKSMSDSITESMNVKTPDVKASQNAEINELLREQNSLLLAILNKNYGRSDDELFDMVQRHAMKFERETGNYAFG